MAKESVKLTLGKNADARVRFSYVNVFEPRENDRGIKQFSTAILIPKMLPNGKANPDVKLIQDAFDRIVSAEKNGTFKGIHASKLNNPLNDGDVKFEEDPDRFAPYEGHYYLNAKRNVMDERRDKVIVMDQYAKVITDPDLFFSGCYGAAIVTLFPYNQQSKGVAVALEAVQYRHGGDDDRLSGTGGTSVNSVAAEFGSEEESDIDEL